MAEYYETLTFYKRGDAHTPDNIQGVIVAEDGGFPDPSRIYVVGFAAFANWEFVKCSNVSIPRGLAACTPMMQFLPREGSNRFGWPLHELVRFDKVIPDEYLTPIDYPKIEDVKVMVKIETGSLVKVPQSVVDKISEFIAHSPDAVYRVELCGHNRLDYDVTDFTLPNLPAAQSFMIRKLKVCLDVRQADLSIRAPGHRPVILARCTGDVFKWEE